MYYAAGRGIASDGVTETGRWRGADVINISWEWEANARLSSALNWAVNHGRNGLGMSIFASAGNEGAGSLGFPAKLSSVIAVGMSTPSDQRDPSSNYGSDLDLLAPGSSATVDRTGRHLGYTGASYYDHFSGTSAAAPLAAGVAALLLSRNPNLTTTQVRDALTGTADKVGDVAYTNGFNEFYGYGRVNAGDAVASVSADLSAPMLTSTTPARFVNPDDDPNAQSSDQRPLFEISFNERTIWSAADIASAAPVGLP